MHAVQSAFEALTRGASRETTLSALELLRKVCYEKSGNLLLDEVLCRTTGQELLDVWDSLLIKRNAEVSTRVFLLFAGLLRYRESACGNQAETQEKWMKHVANAGWNITQDRLNVVVSALLGGSTVRANSAMYLLGSLAKLGGGAVIKIIEAFSIGSTDLSFERVCEGHRGQTGDSYTIVSNHTLMSIDQLSKASSRAFFLHMAMSILDNCAPMFYSTLLSTGSIMKPIMWTISLDPLDSIHDIVRSLARIVLPADSFASKSAKRLLLDPATLCQLGIVCGHSDGGSGVAQPIYTFLLEVCTLPQHGLFPSNSQAAPDHINSQRALIELVCSLRPHVHQNHWKLVVAICQAHPWVAAYYTASSKINILPLSAHQCLMMLGLFIKAVTSGSQARMERVDSIIWSKLSKDNEDASASQILQWCVPLQLSKATIGKLLHAGKEMICCSTLLCLQQILLAVEEILLSLKRFPHTKDLCNSLKAKLSEILPTHASLIQVASSYISKPNLQGEENDMEKKENVSRSKASHVVEALGATLALYWKIIPETLLAGSVDSLMKIWTKAKSTHLLLIAKNLLHMWIEMLGLFQTDLQFLYWAITMIPKHGAGDVSKERHNSILLFLSESLCKIIKAPQLYHDIKVKHLGEKAGALQFDLLSVAVLSDCLKSIFSQRRKMRQTWIVAYTCNVMTMLVQTSNNPLLLIFLIHRMLEDGHCSTSRSESGHVCLPQGASPIQSLLRFCTVFLEQVRDGNPSLIHQWIEQWSSACSSNIVDIVLCFTCTIECDVRSRDFKTVKGTLEELFQYLKLPIDSSNLEASMSSLLLSLPETESLDFILNTAANHPNWMLNKGIASSFREVLSGHCIIDRLHEYLNDVQHNKYDLSSAVTLLPVIRAMLWRPQLRELAEILPWLKDRMHELPAAWHFVTVHFIVGCLSGVRPNDLEGWRIGRELLECLLLSSSKLTSDLSGSILKVVFQHTSTCRILQDDCGWSVASMCVSLLANALEMQENKLNPATSVLQASERLSCILEEKLANNQKPIPLSFVETLTSIAPFILTPLKIALANEAIESMQKKNEIFPAQARFSLQKFAMKSDEGRTALDYQFLSLLGNLQNYKQKVLDILLQNWQPISPILLSIATGARTLIDVMKACFRSNYPEGFMLAQFLVQREPICKEIFADLWRKSLDTGKWAMLPIAIDYLQHASSARIIDDKFTEDLANAMSVFFHTANMGTSPKDISDRLSLMLHKYGSKYLATLVHYWGINSGNWMETMAALLPVGSWLDKPESVRTDSMILAGHLMVEHMPQVLTTENLVACRVACKFACVVCHTLARIFRVSVTSPGIYSDELQIASNQLTGFVVKHLQRLPDAMRESSEFSQVCKRAGKMARCVLLHSPTDVKRIKMIRILFSSLYSMSRGTTSISSGVDTGHTFIHQNRIAGDLASKIACELMTHSVFDTPIQGSESNGVQDLTHGASKLPRPADSILPAMGSEYEQIQGIGKQRVSLQTELILLLEALLIMKENFSKEHFLDESQASTYAHCLASLLMGYEATLSGKDIAALRVIHILNWRIYSYNRKSYSDLFCKPLVIAGYSFGVSARTLHLEGRLVPQFLMQSGSDVDRDSSDLFYESRRAAMEQRPVVCHSRCAMTTVYYPEGRSLNIDEEPEDFWMGVLASKKEGCYDPAFMIPFCETGLSQGWLKETDFWRSGLLGLCLRASSSEDATLRCLAAKVVRMYQDILISSPNSKGKYGLKLLLQIFLRVAGVDNRRLPSSIAVFLAEASAQFTRGNSKISGMLRTFLETCSEATEFTEIPLANTILSSADCDKSLIWMLELLKAGMHGTSATGIFNVCRIFPKVMMLHETMSLKSEFKAAALSAILQAVQTPKVAKHLVKSAGLISWLVDHSSAYCKASSDQEQSDSVSNLRTVYILVRALHNLLQMRVGLGSPTEKNNGIIHEHVRGCWALHELLSKICSADADACTGNVISTCADTAVDSKKDRGYFAHNSIRGHRLAEILFELLMYTETLVSLWVETGRSPHSLVFDWTSLCRVLPWLDFVPNLLGIDASSVQGCIMNILLKLEVGPPSQSAAWTEAADWGIGMVLRWSQIDTPETNEELSVNTCDKKLTKTCRFLMWLATCLLKEFPVASRWQNGSTIEGLFRVHQTLSEAEKCASSLALLVCMIHFAEPYIRRVKQSWDDQLRKEKNGPAFKLMEILAAVELDPKSLPAIWSKSIIMGWVPNLDTNLDPQRILVTFIREAVAGSQKFELAGLHSDVLDFPSKE